MSEVKKSATMTRPRNVMEPIVKLPVMPACNDHLRRRVPTENALVGSSLLCEVFPLASDTPPPSVKPLVVDPKVIPLPGMLVEAKIPRRRMAREIDMRQ